MHNSVIIDKVRINYELDFWYLHSFNSNTTFHKTMYFTYIVAGFFLLVEKNVLQCTMYPTNTMTCPKLQTNFIT